MWFVVLAYGFQLYFDFSGYSDIAIGSAQIMGYDLMTNFNSTSSKTVNIIFISPYYPLIGLNEIP